MLYAIVLLMILAAAVIYLLRLDERLPQLSLFQVVLLLLIAQMLDFTTFIIVTGGKATSLEINPAYQLLLTILTHTSAAVGSHVAGLLVVGIVILCFWLRGSRRGTLTWLAVSTVFSLVGAFFNAAGGIPTY